MKFVLCRLVSLALILAQMAGCAGSLPPPPSEIQRFQFGKVGVVSKFGTPVSGLGHGAVRGEGLLFGEEEPVVGEGKGAARGAAEGALAAVASAGAAGPIGIILIPLFAPIGAIIGAAVGASSAIPAETAKQFERHIREALVEANPQALLLRSVVDTARQEGISDLRALSETNPAPWDQISDYTEFHKAGIDTVLEVGVIKIGLIGHAGRGGADPWLSLLAQAGVRLVNTKTNTDVYSRKNISTTSPPRRLSEWRKNSADLFRKELAPSFVRTAQRIVEHVFLVIR